MILEALKQVRFSGFVVVYMTDNKDLYASDIFDSYDEAIAFVTDGEAKDYKAIIVGAGGLPFMMATDDRT